MRKNNLLRNVIIPVAVVAIALVTGEYVITNEDSNGIFDQAEKVWENISTENNAENTIASVDVTDYSNTGTVINGFSIPQFEGTSCAYVVNENEPFFYTGEYTTETYITFSDLDNYGRAGVAEAVVGPETMQTEERSNISSIHPSGWWEAKQTDINVNRSHLLMNKLCGNISDCEENMITGSRQLNAGTSTWDGSMLDYEMQVVDYIEETGNHVHYRVTPVFENVDVTAKGVLMEAESQEDMGEGLKFCVYIYNVQPEYVCDYTTGVWEKITTAEVFE